MLQSLIRRSSQLTTLPNKIRVASDPAAGHFNSLGVYLHAGSRIEKPEYSGISHIIDKLAFKSTQNRDEETISNQITALGGQFMCSSSRETIMYQSAIFKKDLSAAMDILSDTIRNPNLSEEELDFQRQSAFWEIKEIYSKPDMILPELVHHTAYKNNTLGNPLLCPEERLNDITPTLVQNYLNDWFRPDRIVIAGCGIDHNQLVELSEKHFGDMKALTPLDQENANKSATYTGGDLYIEDNTQDMTHIYVAFEGVGIDDDDVYATAVLQMLLGGGGSFSAGGPGKGMYSRCYTHVLNYHYAVDYCASFHHCYADSGLFGISAVVLPGYNSKIVDILARELTLLTLPPYLGGINQVELDRSKNQLKSSLMMALESRLVQVEDLGRQVQINDRRVSIEEMCEKIDQVDLETIRRVAIRILRPEKGDLNNGQGSGEPTVVAQGPLKGIKDIRRTLKNYGLGG